MQASPPTIAHHVGRAQKITNPVCGFVTSNSVKGAIATEPARSGVHCTTCTAKRRLNEPAPRREALCRAP